MIAAILAGITGPAWANELSVENLFATAHAFRYAPDGRRDYWQSAEETQRRRSGDCEDKAVWLYTELRRSGYENVHLVIGRYTQVSPGLHVWLTLTDDSGSIWVLDPTIQRKPWKADAFPKSSYEPLIVR